LRNLFSRRLIQATRRLIENQNFGPLQQCPCNRNPLLLPAR
jgi:hypothetical protein